MLSGTNLRLGPTTVPQAKNLNLNPRRKTRRPGGLDTNTEDAPFMIASSSPTKTTPQVSEPTQPRLAIYWGAKCRQCEWRATRCLVSCLGGRRWSSYRRRRISCTIAPSKCDRKETKVSHSIFPSMDPSQSISSRLDQPKKAERTAGPQQAQFPNLK